MAGKTIKVRSRNNGEFDCYIAKPASNNKVPAIVLASAIHGVNADICGIADEFAAAGYLAAAPDLFWRTIPGPATQGGPAGRLILATRGNPHWLALGPPPFGTADPMS